VVKEALRSERKEGAAVVGGKNEPHMGAVGKTTREDKKKKKRIANLKHGVASFQINLVDSEKKNTEGEPLGQGKDFQEQPNREKEKIRGLAT